MFICYHSLNLQTNQCLILLQKLISMRPVYMGENKMIIGKCYFCSINQMIISNIGLNNSENIDEFCKLIFSLKKNFSNKDICEQSELIANINKFALNLISYFPKTINGLTYLLLFFSTFSKFTNINQASFIYSNISNTIREISQEVLNTLFGIDNNKRSETKHNNFKNASMNNNFSSSVNINNISNLSNIDIQTPYGFDSFCDYNLNSNNGNINPISFVNQNKHYDLYEEVDEFILQDFIYAFGELTTGM